jgi:hypothetical protein
MPVLKVRFNHRFEEKKYYYKVQGHSFQHFKFVKKKKKKSFNIYVNYVIINCTFDHTNIHHMIHHMIVFK